jgi:hypothetical protein
MRAVVRIVRTTATVSNEIDEGGKVLNHSYSTQETFGPGGHLFRSVTDLQSVFQVAGVNVFNSQF